MVNIVQIKKAINSLILGKKNKQILIELLSEITNIKESINKQNFISTNTLNLKDVGITHNEPIINLNECIDRNVIFLNREDIFDDKIHYYTYIKIPKDLINDNVLSSLKTALNDDSITLHDILSYYVNEQDMKNYSEIDAYVIIYHNDIYKIVHLEV